MYRDECGCVKLARTWPAGSMILWVAVLLTAYLALLLTVHLRVE
jgi:hypothetical protein